MEVFRRLGIADRRSATPACRPEYPQRRVLLRLGDRHGAVAHQAAVARRPRPRREGRRRLVADARSGRTGSTSCSSSRCCSRTPRRSRASASSTAPSSRNSPRTSSGVTGIARDLDSGERITIRCRYLVGCDGGRSAVRHGIGAELAGIPVVQRVQSTYFRAPKLKSMLPGEPAWMYLAFNPRRCGTMMSIDGKETLADPQFPLQRRAGLRLHRSRLGDPQRSSASARSSNTRSSPRRTGSAAGWSPTASRTAACSSPATPRICGFRTPATA